MGGLNPDGLDDEFWRILSADIKPEEHWPNVTPLIAHYSSLSSIEKILSNQQIWFAHPYNMNDVEELSGLVQAACREVLRSEDIQAALGTELRHTVFMSCFVQAIQRFDERTGFDIYIFCCSLFDPEQRDGLLSMWRAYGADGDGAAIVFDTAKLTAIPESPFIVAPVQYYSRDEREEKIQEMIARVAAFFSSKEVHQDLFGLMAHLLMQRIILAATFTKHKGFAEEKEWRIAYQPYKDNDRVCRELMDYHISDRGIEPKLKLPLKPLSGVVGENTNLANIVDRIILGPTAASALAENTFRGMLAKMKFDEMQWKVYSADIPYRSFK